MKAFIKNTYFQMSIFLCLAVALIYWQYTALSHEELTEIKNSFSVTKWHFIFIALVVGFLSHYFRALRWRLMLAHLGHQTSKDIVTGSVLMGYLTNLLVPRLGEVMKCTTLYKYNKVPIDKSLGSVVSERIFDVLSLFILFFLVLVIEFTQVSHYAETLLIGFQEKFDIQIKWWWLIILTLLFISGIILIKFIYKRIVHSKIGQFIGAFLQGVQSIISLPQKGLFIFYTIMIWCLYILMVYVAMQAVPATAGLALSVSMVLTAFGSIAIILTPGGIGAYPPIIAGLLTIYNIPYSYGLSAGWVSWLMQTLVVIILGILTLIYLPLSQNKIQEDDRDNSSPMAD